jgi:hypothetical protein
MPPPSPGADVLLMPIASPAISSAGRRTASPACALPGLNQVNATRLRRQKPMKQT